METNSQDVILSLKNISKQYPGVQALDDVSIDFYRGEIHCLLGENGAGKSTLIKMISGADQPDGGTIEFEDMAYNAMEPHISRSLGIEVIYQEFNLVPSVPVYENIFLGTEIRKNGLIDSKTLIDKTKELFNSMQVGIDPNTLVNGLTVAYMQLVEIAKALSKDAKLLILDEPTAPLTETEVNILFGLVRQLKEQGVTIIYISHRLNEIYELGDRLTVMRDGKKVVTQEVSETTRDDLITYMVGREMKESYPARNNKIGDVILEVKHITGEGAEDISFSVRKGEILGLAGLVGAGRTETLRLIFGADILYGGAIYIDGKYVRNMTPEKAVAMGVGLVPEDRKQHGLLLEQSNAWNISLPTLKKISKNFFVQGNIEQEIAEDMRVKFRIKTPSMDHIVGHLSGGNQQKVVLAKWIASKCRILFFDEPTRGIDVGAKQEIYQLMTELAEQGIAIVMVSSEMDEIIGMSDRIIVLHEGRMAGELSDNKMTQEEVLRYASGMIEGSEHH